MIAGAKRERTDPTDDKQHDDAEQQQQQPKRATTEAETMGDEMKEVALDENLHSRQLAVYGREVMKRMAASNVLISGANGLGLEIGE